MNTPEIIRVGIVDDHEMVRDGLASLVAHVSGMEVAWTASGIREAEKRLRHSCPDVVIADLSLDDGNGTEIVHSIRRRRGKTRVLILTGCADPYAVSESLREGAAGYVVKGESTDHLVEAIRALGSGARYFPPRLGLTSPEQDGPLSGFERLSRRESEIFRMTVRGLAVKDIACRLFISSKTVQTHRTNINRKLAVRTASDLIRLAAASGVAIAPRGSALQQTGNSRAAPPGGVAG